MPAFPAYQPSGQLSVTKLAYGIPAGIAAAVVVGIVYQYLINWIPLIILDALLVFGLGFGMFMAAGLAVKMGHCRNPLIGTAIGLVVGLSGLAMTYEVSRHSIANEAADELSKSDDLGARAIAPAVRNMSYRSYVHFKMDTGWSIGRASSSTDHGAPLSGAFVLVIWGIEAIIAVAGGVLGARAAAAAPFCEECTSWATTAKTLWSVSKPSPAVISQVLTAPDLESMAAAATGGGGLPTTALNFKLSHCPVCKARGYLTIEHETTSLDKHGKEQKSAKALQSNLEVDPATAEAVLASH